MRQPSGSGDIIEILLIDADPAAFGHSQDGPASGSRPARARRPRPRWLAPAALLACTSAAVAVFVWQPWEVPPQWRLFEAPSPTASNLSNLLLPATAPGVVQSVVEPDSVGSNTPTVQPGVVFAEPGATYGFRRAALFEASPTGARDAAPGEESAGEESAAPMPTVHGIPAALDRFRLRTDIEWGPLDGHTWRAFTTGFDEEESLAFAAAVGTPTGTAAIRHDYPLDGMVPLGSVSAFNSAYALRNELTGGHLSSPLSPTVVTYLLDDERSLRVASVPAPTDAMQLVGYVFGAGTATTVHGQPAQLIDAREAGPMIIWLEGGRLITVAGPQTDEQLRVIAESVAPVSPEEWLNATRAVLSFYIPVDTWPDDSSPIDVGSGVTSAGVPWRVAISIGNPTVTCVYFGVGATTTITFNGDGTSDTVTTEDNQSQCTFSTPRVPATRSFTGAYPGITFVVAIVPIEDFRLVLRVTSADGTITDFQPVRLNDRYTGVAAAIADDATTALVDPSA